MTEVLNLITIDSLLGVQIAWLVLGAVVGGIKITPPELFFWVWLTSD